MREGFRRAIDKGLPIAQLLNVGTSFQRSRDTLEAIVGEKHQTRSAISAASNIRSARTFVQQASEVTEDVRPILYYYGGLSFLEFITSVLVRRQKVGKPGHGLSVSCASEGWDFDGRWARQNVLWRWNPLAMSRSLWTL